MNITSVTTVLQHRHVAYPSPMPLSSCTDCVTTQMIILCPLTIHGTGYAKFSVHS